MAAGLFDYLTTVSDYLNSLESSLYKDIVAVITYVDALAAWSGRAFLGLATWSVAVDDAQAGVDNIIAQAFLGGVVEKTADDLRKLAQSIWDILQSGEIARIWRWLKRVFSKLKKWIEKLRKYLEQLKKQLQDQYNTYIRPIMDLLQRMRKVLFLFRILGFKWARKLDQDIAKLEAKINAAFLKQYQAINQVIDWIVFFTDPLGIFNPVIFTLSAIQSIGDLWNALWQYQAIGILSGPSTDQQAAAHKYDMTTEVAQARQMLATGLLPEDQAIVAQFRAAFQSSGYPVR
jgi:hypothetical protein